MENQIENRVKNLELYTKDQEIRINTLYRIIDQLEERLRKVKQSL